MIEKVLHLLLQGSWIRQIKDRLGWLHNVLHPLDNLQLNFFLDSSLFIFPLFLLGLLFLQLGRLEYFEGILVMKDCVRKFILEIVISQKVLDALRYVWVLQHLVDRRSSLRVSLQHCLQKGSHH